MTKITSPRKTGLKDVDGIEIKEGDALCLVGDAEITGIVEFDGTNFITDAEGWVWDILEDGEIFKVVKPKMKSKKRE